MQELNADIMAKAYVRMRDARQKLLREFEAADAVIMDQMKEVEAALLEFCKDTGADSVKTAHGTVIRSVKTRYWTNDWALMHDFIAQNNAVDLLEKRIQQTNMKTWIEDHPDVTPPGLNIDRAYTVTVRRPTKGS